MNLEQGMQLAINEAFKGAPFVSPNPKVGCVILDRNGELLSTGFHQKFGGPHAEVEALKALNPESLKGAHVIVTLEPCAHEGKTPSCAKTLAALPIKKVTFGLVDPNPLVAGQGAEILRRAGIEVDEYQGPLKNSLEQVCEEFLWNFRHRKVFVSVKIAQSLDGKIALPNGESKWITGAESRLKVHELRSSNDAVLVGKNTILKDNPSLNVRGLEFEKENRVVVLDRSGEVLRQKNNLQIFKSHHADKIIVLSAENLNFALKELYDLGIRSVMVEGGGKIFSDFLKQGLVQRLHLFTAPVILGEGIRWSEGISLSSMAEKKELKFVQSSFFGNDHYLTARF